MTDGRQHDLDALRKAYSQTADAKQREHIRDIARKITNESARIKSMRVELVKAHKRGDTENIKDIHSYIKKKKEYSND